MIALPRPTTRLLIAALLCLLASACDAPNGVITGDPRPSEGAASPESAIPAPAQPNVLLLIADDFGVESSVCHDAPTSRAPRLAEFCENAVVFDEAWSSPICSPTRAGMLTGRHSFRTGVTEQVTGRNGVDLDSDEWTLPRILDAADSGYTHANFGKWHLGGESDQPNDMGWDHFSGTISGALSSYTSWTKTVDGVEEQSNEYATTVTVDDASSWIADQTDPWLAWVAFNAPHTPFHLPPADDGRALHTQDLSGSAADIEANPSAYYDAAIEALDTEIGRLIDSLGPNGLDETLVIFVGDNGNPNQVTSYNRRQAKGSLGAGGVHVPMMMWGHGVDSGQHRSSSVVGTVDVFQTILDVAGVDLAAVVPNHLPIDARTLVPELSGGSIAPGYVLSEIRGLQTEDDREGTAIRDNGHQLIRYDDGQSAFYNLASDPRTESPVAAGQRTVDEQQAHDRLLATLSSWTASPTAPSPN